MEIVVRATVIYFFLWLLTRALGKRELAEMTAFELLLLVVVGDLIQQGVTQSDYSLTGAVLTVGTFALLTIVFSYANYRFKPLRPYLEAEPRIVIQDGKPVERNLRRERLTVEEIAAEARLQQIPSLDAVEWAVLEGSGKISFLTRT